MKKIVTATAFCLLSTVAVSASATVIDFQPLEQSNGIVNFQGFTYSEDGFTVNNLETTSAFSTFGTLESRYLGSTALFNNTINGTTELVKDDGSAFDLISIDLGELNGPANAAVTFVGNYGSGGTVSQTFNLDTYFQTNNTLSFQTFSFTGFTGVTSVTWDQTASYHQFDNITLDTSAVPEPTTMLLFGTGIAGLAAVSRRRKK